MIMKRFIFLLIPFFICISSCKKDSISDIKAKPEVSGYYPNSGNAGLWMTIEGKHFKGISDDLSINFGDQPAEILSTDSTHIIIRVPEGKGKVPIVFQYHENKLSLGDFTYQDLSVQRISPSQQGVGQLLRIYGQGFSITDSSAKVWVNGIAAEISDVKDTLLTVLVPEGHGKGPIKVNIGDKEGLGPDFEYLTIDSTMAMTGGVGTNVKLFIDGLQNTIETPIVSFSNLSAKVIKKEGKLLVVEAPAKVATGPIFINIGQSTIKTPNFEVVPIPELLKISQLSGGSGAKISIEGKNFSTLPEETTLWIGDQSIPISSVTKTNITFVVPPGINSGKIKIKVNDQQVEGAIFTVQDLFISDFYPKDGLAGTEVEIQGNGFSIIPQENLVSFNGVTAQVTQASGSKLKVIVPEGVSTGMIQVQTKNMKSISTQEFLRAGMVTLGKGKLNISSNNGKITVDKNNNIYVLETGQHRIMKISPDGVVTHFAGSTNNEKGLRNGKGSDALFHLNAYSCLTFGTLSNRLFLSEPDNQAIRSINLDGTVSTLRDANSSNRTPPPMINQIVDYRTKVRPSGYNIYVETLFLDYKSHMVSNYTSQYGTYAPVTEHYPNNTDLQARPVFYAVQSTDRTYEFYGIKLFVADNNQFIIGENITNPAIIGSQVNSGYKDGNQQEALFQQITGLCLKDEANVYILDLGNFAVRKYNGITNQVSTVFKTTAGFSDGDFRNAKISNSVQDIAVSADGNTVYLLDNGNNCIRKIMFR